MLNYIRLSLGRNVFKEWRRWISIVLPHTASFHCSQPPRQVCIVSETYPEWKTKIIFTAFSWQSVEDSRSLVPCSQHRHSLDLGKHAVKLGQFCLWLELFFAPLSVFFAFTHSYPSVENLVNPLSHSQVSDPSRKFLFFLRIFFFNWVEFITRTHFDFCIQPSGFLC